MIEASFPTERATRLVRAGRIADAYNVLDQAASSDPGASFMLAEWRMTGSHIRRDLKEARRLYGVAARLGSERGLDCHIALLANGAGGIVREWGTAMKLLSRSSVADHVTQTSLLSRMKIGPEGLPVSVEPGKKIHETADIWSIPNFLDRRECRYLVRAAHQRLQPSVVVHPATGQLFQDPIRQSSAAAFPFTEEKPVIHAINQRIAAATNTVYEQGEPLQILHYSSGQEYKLHSDALPTGQNQRLFTFLIYLNDAFTGGETNFPRLGITHCGQPGDALMFRNVDAAGYADPLLVHAGLPVSGGEKYLASKWIRVEPLDISGPSGRPF